MPQMGESIAEGTIVKWLKSPGDKVLKDEDLLIISTDKVEAEIPSPDSGVLLSIDVEEGETVQIGTVLGSVGSEGEKPSKSAAKKQIQKAEIQQDDSTKDDKNDTKPAAVNKEQNIQTATISSSIVDTTKSTKQNDFTKARFLSPLVRRIAVENHVTSEELVTLPGSGKNGRVTKSDIFQYIENRNHGIVNITPTTLQKPSSSPKLLVPKSSNINIPPGQNELIKPASTMRKVIAENMINSKSTSAHVTTIFNIDYTNIDKIRALYKDQFKAQEGVSLTYTTFLAFALCQCLKRHSYINAQLQDNKIVFKKDVNLAIAVAIDAPEPGLMVPVIRNADQMNLRGLAHSIADLAFRVRNKQIKPNELSSGTFTITNPGNYGGIIATPIINQPQVAILGVGNIYKQPVVVSSDGVDSIAIKNQGMLSLSFDHRLIDGATADLFMADLKSTLESWSTAP